MDWRKPCFLKQNHLIWVWVWLRKKICMIFPRIFQKVPCSVHGARANMLPSFGAASACVFHLTSHDLLSFLWVVLMSAHVVHLCIQSRNHISEFCLANTGMTDGMNCRVNSEGFVGHTKSSMFCVLLFSSGTQITILCVFLCGSQTRCWKEFEMSRSFWEELT